jgi:hypothetical protein
VMLFHLLSQRQSSSAFTANQNHLEKIKYTRAGLALKDSAPGTIGGDKARALHSRAGAGGELAFRHYCFWVSHVILICRGTKSYCPNYHFHATLPLPSLD